MSAPVLSVEQLRQAVDAYRLAHDGRFPTSAEGWALPGLAWGTVDARLRDGACGLPGGTTLSKWLDEAYPAERSSTPYTSASLRDWVTAYREANGGAFPHVDTGAIPGTDRTWKNVNDALRRGLAFTKCRSLSTWLDDQFPHDRRKKAALITSDLILTLVEAYRAEHDGEFPYRETGKVAGINMTWTQLDNALLQGGKSLAKWLAKRHPEFVELPEQRLRTWVEDYARENERALPAQKSGDILGTGWSWQLVDRAFRTGAMAWATSGSLSAWLDATFPAERFLSSANLRMWVDEHLATHGTFPTKDSALPVAETSSWTWRRIDRAMHSASCGWPEKSSLSRWLDRQYPDLRTLNPGNLQAWVADYLVRHLEYPTKQSLEPAAPGGHWSWAEIDLALQRESSGWKGKTTLESWIKAHMAPVTHEADELFEIECEGHEGPALA
jgi:hypothetical protein